jgi:hypothetical protein
MWEERKRRPMNPRMTHNHTILILFKFSND